MIRRVIIVGMASAILTACGQERPAIQKPPIDLLTCADEPDAPNLPDRSQQAVRDTMVFDYILAMRTSWGDCKSKVSGIKAWVDALGE